MKRRLVKHSVLDLALAALSDQRPRALVELTLKNLEKAKLTGTGPVFDALAARGMTLDEALAEARGES